VYGCYDFVSGKIQALVTLVLAGISNEDIAGRPWCKLVGHCGGQVWEAQAAKNTKMGVVWFLEKKRLIWSEILKRMAGSSVMEICGGLESMDPIARFEMGLKQQGTHNIIDRANSMLSLAILR
jgi:hypothetical protein